jgi:hypothetical protein
MIKKRIGIDLDNTIINYNNSFIQYLKEKKIYLKRIDKDKIKKISNDNPKIINWTHVQEKIYGKYIKYAKPFSYYKKFEKFALKNNFKLFIISHKTKYSEYSKRFNLHEKSKEWLKKNIKIDNYKIFFHNNINDKIKRISSLKLDYYIDDLDKIFKKKNYPKKTKKIFFSNKKLDNTFNLKNWKEILTFIKKNENIK